MYPSHIILLNGPPGCGKDTAANFISGEYGYDHLKFAAPIRRAFCATFGVKDDELQSLKKADFMGTTVRQWMIDFSEKLMKPLHGQAIFAYLLAQYIARCDIKKAVISDCGFQVEVDTFRTLFPFTKFTMIHLFRNGHQWAGDSRERVDIPGQLAYQVYNDSSQAQLEHELTAIMERA